MPEPLLTVLMPVYNAQKYLRQAIDSILNQTFTNFEFIIIDDGSADDSVSIVESYKDEKIRLVKNEKNIGITATLNRGIDLSAAPLIARMDADDISYPSRLQKQYDYFLSHPDCVLVSSWAREITEEGEPSAIMEFNSDYYYYMLNYECWIYHSSVMYKKNAVEQVGKYTVPYSEDFELWWQLSRRYKIYNIPEVLLDYRLSDTGQSRVTKFKETNDIQHNQVLRNIRYYTGKDFELSNNEVEFLRYNLDPILEEGKLKSLLKALKKLDSIGDCFRRKDRLYNNREHLVAAVNFQKKRIIAALRKKLPAFKLGFVLILSGYYKVVFKTWQ